MRAAVAALISTVLAVDVCAWSGPLLPGYSVGFGASPPLARPLPVSAEPGFRPVHPAAGVLPWRGRVVLGVGDMPLEEPGKPSAGAKVVAKSAKDTTDLLNQVALVNFATIAVFALAVADSLLHERVVASLALFQFDDIMEADALATSVDLFLRFPMDSLRSYEELVPQNPIFYKACTSGVAYCIGDFVSQVYQGHTLEDLDLKRTARSGVAGFIGHGPLCHLWMSFMETYLDFGGAWWATGVKITLDQTLWGVYLNACYSFIIGILAFRPLQEVWDDVKSTSWPALKTSWRFWPFVHTISFCHAVPLDLKLLWVDVMEIVWVTLLSKISNDDRQASKTAATMVVEDGVALVPEEGAQEFSLKSGGITDPAAEITISKMKEKGQLALGSSAAEFLPAPDTSEEVPPAPASPALSDHEEELSSKVMGLATKGAAAAWPLLAMWPLLFASYNLQVALGIEGGVGLQ